MRCSGRRTLRRMMLQKLNATHGGKLKAVAARSRFKFATLCPISSGAEPDSFECRLPRLKHFEAPKRFSAVSRNQFGILEIRGEGKWRDMDHPREG